MCADVSEAENILLRLRRIVGQVRGLQRMVDELCCCEELLTQIIALKLPS